MSKFSFDSVNKCFKVEFPDCKKTILVDTEDLEKVFHAKSCKTKYPKWQFDEEIDDFYFVNSNLKNVYLLENIFGVTIGENDWFFKNNNTFDYRKKNIDIKSINNIKLPKNLKIVKSHEGHVSQLGKNAGKECNPYWLVKDNKDANEKEFYVMYCEKDTFCYFSKESLDIVLDNNNNIDNDKIPTWYKTTNGYIGTHSDTLVLLIHQLLIKYDKKTQIIQHINENLADNRISNLKIVNKDEIKPKVAVKRQRNKNAVELPEEIDETDIPVYVVYNREVLNKKTGRWRDFFTIEKHPKLQKKWSTTKSMKIPITDKLIAAKQHLKYLDTIKIV